MSSRNNLKQPFLKPLNSLNKGFYSVEESRSLYHPSEIVETADGEVYITEDTPVGKCVTEENGEERILFNPFKKAREADTFSLAAQYRAKANTLFQKTQEQQREISRLQRTTSYVQSSVTPNASIAISMTCLPQKTAGITYYNEVTGIYELLCNFNIHIIKIIENYHNDRLIDRKVCFNVVMENKEVELEVEYSQIDSIVKIIQKKEIEAIVYASVTKAEKKLEEVFRGKLKNIPVEKHQCAAGWMSWGDKKIFAHDAHMQVEQSLKMQTGKKLIFKQNLLHSPYAIFTEILRLAPIQVIAPMIAVCLLGPLHALFMMANVSYAPRFVLFINGKTGSLKTAVSKILFTFFNADNPLIPASFKDTKTALEMRLKEYQSVPVLIDDFYSTGLKKEYTAMQEILEMIVRYVGDGIGKNRSNSQLEDVKGTPPSGMVVVTGEDTAGQMSTLLRCLIINVDKGTFDGKVLSEFQKNPYQWSSFLFAFISYLEENYLQIIAMISTRFETLRANYESEFTDRRPMDQMIQMQITYEILRDFLLKWSSLDDNDIVDIINNCINGCSLAVHNSLEYVKENSGENQYIFAMAKLINGKKLVIAMAKKNYEENPQKYDGFMDNTYFYLRSDAVYIKVRKYFQEQGRELAISALNANRALDKAGVLVTEIENRGTNKEKKLLEVKVKIGDKRPRMLKISQELFWSFIEQNTM